MAISRAVAQTITQLIERVRREVGDRSTDKAGNTIPAAGRRWSDAEITEAINDQLLEMGTIMSILHSGEALVYTDLAYSDEGDNEGDALPAGINAEGIALVTDVTDANTPLEVFRLNWRDQVQIPVNDPYTSVIGRRFYSLSADPASNNYRILIRPDGTGRTFRIYWLAVPFVTGATGDAPLLSARWRDYIGLGAAIKLLSIDDEVPEQLGARFARQDTLFRAFASRQKNPEKVRMIRRFL